MSNNITDDNIANIKQEVRQFYDQVGWSLVSDDVYQNAHYEDLRPVSREYIHRCHLRVCRHLQSIGTYILDAGSGPIQYPEYLEYSRGYQYRICADISFTALKEARKRISDHGLFVVTDIANLPFKSDVFDGVISLHTIHHLPENEHLQAYNELYRVLAPDRSAAVVNGWPSSSLMGLFEPLIRLKKHLRSGWNHLTGRSKGKSKSDKASRKKGKGTFTNRHDVPWIYNVVGAQMPVKILVWRAVSVRFLRTFIQPWLGGRYWLRLLYRLEERFPRYFGENGQYPLIVINKPGSLSRCSGGLCPPLPSLSGDEVKNELD